MFETARLKLTAWYLLIIMAISVAFSIVIYRSVTSEFHRRLNAIELRLELDRYGFRLPPGQEQYFLQDLVQAKHRVFLVLLYTNGVILVCSAVAGYFLAGKTLAPIERAMEEQKRFVADASHELKTPLTALQTSIEVALRDTTMNLKGAKAVLKENLHDIGRLTHLTHDLLSLARYQHNNRKFVKERVAISDLLAGVHKKIAPVARKRGIAIKIVPVAVSLVADKESLEKLITILLENAVTYTPRNGSITVTLKKHRRHAALVFADTGIGITKKDLPHIFERFYRADSSRSYHTAAGYGLGLSLAKNIVLLHQGTIDVSSVPGKGSTFTVKLPLDHS